MKQFILVLFLIVFFNTLTLFSKHIKSTYKVPKGLVKGGAFIDLFLPIPIHEGLETDVWGATNVIPRDMHNGIEDHKWSYWGGNVLTDKNGIEHLYICRWLESFPPGHSHARDTYVVHAVAEKPIGPFKVKHEIGPGHNPEIFRAKDGTYVLYVIGKKGDPGPKDHTEILKTKDGTRVLHVIKNCFASKSLDGPWKSTQIRVDINKAKKIKWSNFTFTEQEDRSILMVTRGGRVGISKDGLSPFVIVTPDSIYPKVDQANLEDPVVWRDEIQYHLVVNDWIGRTAFYMRSKDGIKWIWDDGKAYTTDVIRLEDGTKEGWYKLERPKVRQDKYGRATHMYFAVMDVEKKADIGSDNHSSKNVVVPLLPGRRIKILSMGKEIEIKILAEEGFNPQKDINIKSLKFGASKKVDFGQGSKVIRSEKSGKDLVLYFSNKNCKFTKEDFVGKLIGRDSNGKLLYGYARLKQ